MHAMEIPVDATQGEGGQGQHEINLRHTDPLRMADRHVYYKHGVRALAHARGQAVSFMAKISADAPGSSCHVHLCLYGPEGEPAFGVDDLSLLGQSFLAGLLAYTPELTLLHAPYANSYRRLRPGWFAPSNATWGWDNRSCMVRVVGRGAACRFEFRVPGADANPYHTFAAIIAAGLAGAERGLEPPHPVSGNAYAQAGAQDLPTDLTEALAAFSQSDVVLTAPLSGHRVMINGHALYPPFSFAVILAAIPRWPATAVRVERPQRSEDERPGRSAVSGTAWRRPA